MAKTFPSSLADWNMHAGGTCVPDNARSYDTSGEYGQYTIDPIPGRLASSRIDGYSLKFANTVGREDLPHSGLWHDLGVFRRADSAAKAAREHAKGAK